MKQAVDILTGRDSLNGGQRITQVALNHNARAFAYLDKTGMIREIPERCEADKGKLLEAVVQDITQLDPSKRERTVVITTYVERGPEGSGVREGLKAKGELVRNGATHDILVSKVWTRAMQKEAQYYQVGDVVRFSSRLTLTSDSL